MNISSFLLSNYAIPHPSLVCTHPLWLPVSQVLMRILLLMSQLIRFYTFLIYLFFIYAQARHDESKGSSLEDSKEEHSSSEDVWIQTSRKHLLQNLKCQFLQTPSTHSKHKKTKKDPYRLECRLFLLLNMNKFRNSFISMWLSCDYPCLLQ